MAHIELDTDLSRRNQRSLSSDNKPCAIGANASGRGWESERRQSRSEAVELSDESAGKKCDSSPYAKIRLVSVELCALNGGAFEFKKKCLARGRVECMDATASRKATFSLVCRYKGAEHAIETKDALIDKNNQVECELTLYYANVFYDDYVQDPTVSCEYVVKLSHMGTSVVIESKPVRMPQSVRFRVLRKGDYDDNGAQSTKKEKSGENYVGGSMVTDLQKALRLVGCYFGSCTGYFGDRTGAAVRDFQEYASRSVRYKKSGKDPEESTVVLKGYTVGVYDEVTDRELRRWVEKGYVPFPTLRPGEVDDIGVGNGKGRRGSDDHHKGEVVTKAQKDLEAVGVSPGKQDGWFGDEMKAAVDLFLDAAEKGRFIINGKETDVGEVLQTPRKGLLTPEALVYLERRVRQGAKVETKKETSVVLSDSVGQGGANKPDDVKKVKARLKELGYPVKDESETLFAEDIKAIGFFQAQIIEIPLENGTPAIPDRLISKGKNTEKRLFASDAPKYAPPTKGSEKSIEKDVQDKIHAATGDAADKWKKIQEVWKAVSPYLPEGSKMTSGYRTDKEQRDIVWDMYNKTYKKQIVDKYGEDVWQKYKDMQGVDDAQADPVMCKQIKEAAGQDVAVPGKSNHRYGKAIDVGGISDNIQVRNLLWCSIQFSDEEYVKKVIKERNGCVHFEFK